MTDDTLADGRARHARGSRTLREAVGTTVSGWLRGGKPRDYWEDTDVRTGPLVLPIRSHPALNDRASDDQVTSAAESRIPRDPIDCLVPLIVLGLVAVFLLLFVGCSSTPDDPPGPASASAAPTAGAGKGTVEPPATVCLAVLGGASRCVSREPLILDANLKRAVAPGDAGAR